MESHHPTLPDEPQIKIQKPGRVGKCHDSMTLYRDSMLIDLLIERFAECDGVAEVKLISRSIGVFPRIPEADSVKKMKP